MPTTQSGTETRAAPEAAVAGLGEVHQRLDVTLRQILDAFMQAHDLQRQYTVGTSTGPPAWWLANAHTGWAESPLRIRLELEGDARGRTTEPVLAVHLQGAAERSPQNVHTLGHILHRDTTYRVRLEGSQGTTAVWPQGDQPRVSGPSAGLIEVALPVPAGS